MTIPEIKALCQEVIRLGKRATPGPWERVATYYLSAPGKYGLGKMMGSPSSLQDTCNGDFIAAARTFTPQAAQGFLNLIEFCEEQSAAHEAVDHPLRPPNKAQERLNIICQLFTPPTTT